MKIIIATAWCLAVRSRERRTRYSWGEKLCNPIKDKNKRLQGFLQGAFYIFLFTLQIIPSLLFIFRKVACDIRQQTNHLVYPVFIAAVMFFYPSSKPPLPIQQTAMGIKTLQKFKYTVIFTSINTIDFYHYNYL